VRENIPIFLLMLFSVHLIAFLVVWHRTRKPKYFLIIGTFMLLVSSYGFRVFMPEAHLLDRSVVQILRVMAWVMAFLSVGYSQVWLRWRRRS